MVDKDVKLINAALTMGYVTKEALEAWNRLKKEREDLSKYSHQQIRTGIFKLVERAILFNKHCKNNETAIALSQIKEKLTENNNPEG